MNELIDKDKMISIDPLKWKPVTKEQLEELYGPMESYTWKSYDTGKTLRVWFRGDPKSKFSKDNLEWMNFLYGLTVEEIEEPIEKPKAVKEEHTKIRGTTDWNVITHNDRVLMRKIDGKWVKEGDK